MEVGKTTFRWLDKLRSPEQSMLPSSALLPGTIGAHLHRIHLLPSSHCPLCGGANSEHFEICPFLGLEVHTEENIIEKLVYTGQRVNGSIAKNRRLLVSKYISIQFLN